MRIHCTQKLWAKLPEQVKQAKLPAEPIGIQAKWVNWHANLITIKRRQCIIAVHDATRLPLFMPCLVKKDFAQLEWIWHDTLINTLLKCDINPSLIELAANNLTAPTFDTKCSRSVQGTMRLMAQQLTWHFEDPRYDIGEAPAYSLGAWLSDTPCTVKGVKDVIWPRKAMGELISAL